mgnify:CR=1 FL=1
MKISKQELLERLNADLAWEYAAMIQYVQHASVITGAEYESTIAELLVHANEEMQHAINLSDQIDFLGDGVVEEKAKVKLIDIPMLVARIADRHIQSVPQRVGPGDFALFRRKRVYLK